MDPVEEIRRLYYATSPRTVQRDLARAVELLKTLPDEAARERLAVFMDGLSQMRSEWASQGALPPALPGPQVRDSGRSSTRRGARHG